MRCAAVSCSIILTCFYLCFAYVGILLEMEVLKLLVYRITFGFDDGGDQHLR